MSAPTAGANRQRGFLVDINRVRRLPDTDGIHP